MATVPTAGDVVLYATSEDGVHWDKPNLGRHPFDGSTDYNIITFDKHSPTVIVDPAAPAEERHRMMAWEWRQARRGYWVAHSPDGIDWAEYPANPVLNAGDEILETVTLARDPTSGEYFAFHRRPDRDRFERRLIAVATSGDFRHWSAPKTILVPDERDDEWVQDDEQRSEFYGMAGFCYGGQFLGFLPVFDVMIHSALERDVDPELRTEQRPWEGPIAAQLVHQPPGPGGELHTARSRRLDRRPDLARLRPAALRR